jgi:hypothetical protein
MDPTGFDPTRPQPANTQEAPFDDAQAIRKMTTPTHDPEIEQEADQLAENIRSASESRFRIGWHRHGNCWRFRFQCRKFFSGQVTHWTFWRFILVHDRTW